LHKHEIPLLARVLQVADVYDALRTTRPYKPTLSHTRAVHTMQEEAGKGLWDGELVAEFVAMLEKLRRVA
jgi:putative two-component system response regulator